MTGISRLNESQPARLVERHSLSSTASPNVAAGYMNFARTVCTPHFRLVVR